MNAVQKLLVKKAFQSFHFRVQKTYGILSLTKCILWYPMDIFGKILNSKNRSALIGEYN